MKAAPAVLLAGLLLTGPVSVAFGAEAPEVSSLKQDAPSGGGAPQQGSSGGQSKLEESLVAAKAEAEFFRDQWKRLSLRMEALGIDAITGDEQAIHEKLVHAISELYGSQKRQKQLEETLVKLIEAADTLHRANDETRAKARSAYEVALREAKSVLKGGSSSPVATAPSLEQARIVDIDPETGIAIVNAGRAQGVNVAMPFLIIQDEEVIGQCRILEVREYLSAALIQGQKSKTKKTVRIGDRVVLNAVK